jgi:beta-N-acetylglucosaminidase
LTYYNPQAQNEEQDGTQELTKEQLLKNVGFSMLLNEKSGLSLAQFKKIFANDKNDKNNVFKDNAEYFYYAEQQYDINGVFVAAVAIHESGWGTSSISLAKKNLFGYQAYDRNPYENASNFGTYAEGIDLVSRVFVKYYLNPAGKSIYGGEKAVASYYKGSTLTAVNTSYASDKNWANGVYNWMVYLYNKL